MTDVSSSKKGKGGAVLRISQNQKMHFVVHQECSLRTNKMMVRRRVGWTILDPKPNPRVSTGHAPGVGYEKSSGQSAFLPAQE